MKPFVWTHTTREIILIADWFKYNLNDLRGAMADYDRVIETDPNNLIARFNRGLLRAQVADNNRAIEDFNKVLELNPITQSPYSIVRCSTSKSITIRQH